MERSKTTPKDFFLWAGAMITLYASVIALISLFFDYINYAFPDTLKDYYYYGAPQITDMSMEIATLVVLFPTFLILMRIIRKDIEAESGKRDIWIRRWALFLTLFAAGATIAGDLITLLYYFLSGEEMTVRFLLKVLVVLLVASAGFMHFLADWWGFWTKNPKKARSVGYAVGLLIVLAIGTGFVVIGTPWEARQMRLDNQRVTDLQTIQSQVVTFWQQKQRLPETLAELNDPLSYYRVPVDPETGVEYVYRATGPLSFEVCADFKTAMIGGRPDPKARPLSTEPSFSTHVGGDNSNSWDHPVGNTCFERTIDPERYPVFTKPAF